MRGLTRSLLSGYGKSVDFRSSEQPIQTGTAESEKERRQRDFRDECEQTVREVLSAPPTRVERIKPYVLAVILCCVIVVAVGGLTPLLWLGVSIEFIRAAEICARVLLVVVGGCLLVGIWLLYRSDAEEKRVQSLLEQKTTALLNAPPNSSQALALAAEVDAIMCYGHRSEMSDDSVKDYLRHQEHLYEDIVCERNFYEMSHPDWLTKAGGRESFSCLHSYRTSFSFFDEYKSQITQILRAFGIPKRLCSSDAASLWLMFPFYFPTLIFEWLVPQKDTAATSDETPNYLAEQVDLLLRIYVRCRGEELPSLTLRQSQPLGPLGTDADNRIASYYDISNRLKVLADLNPVRYREPVTATLTVSVEDGATGEPCNERLRLYFDDRCADPFCRIEMDQTSSPTSATSV